MFVERGQVEAALPGYELGGTLGAGASGVVLEARHRQISRQVAVKVLTRAGQEARAGFRQEAEVLAGLDHPHIVRIYDYVERGDLSLLIMEHLSGGTLRARQATTTTSAACAVGLAAADALAAAHAAGVLHRDVKPANILFARDGAPKLVDFGISRFFAGSGTSVDSIAGTPGYMAPEQIGGGRVGAGTDLYALGVVLFRLLSGRMPIDPKLPPAQVWKRQLDEPAPAPPGVAGPLTAVISQALQRQRDDRQRSAREFARQLAEAATAVLGPGWLAGSGITVRTDRLVLDATRALPAPRDDNPPVTPPPAVPPPTSRGATQAAPPPVTRRAPVELGHLTRPTSPTTAQPAPLAPREAAPREAAPHEAAPHESAPHEAAADRSAVRAAGPSMSGADAAPPATVPAAPPTPGPASLGGFPVTSTGRRAAGANDGDLVIETAATGPRVGRRPDARRGVVLAAVGGLLAAIVTAVVLLRPTGPGAGHGGRQAGVADGSPPAATLHASAVPLGARVLGGTTGTTPAPGLTRADGGADPTQAAGTVVGGLVAGTRGSEVAVGRRTTGLTATSSASSAPTASSTPTAWASPDGRQWQDVAVPLPSGAIGGEMTAVAFLAGRGFVAVGAVSAPDPAASDPKATGTKATGTAATGGSASGGPDGAGSSPVTRRPAVWRSTDGRSWDVLAGTGLTGDVTGLLARDGGLLAVGRPAGATGDGAVWRSSDGARWTRLATPSLSGPAEQHVDSLVELADGSLLAAGSEVSGSATVTRLRRSTDGAQWNLAATPVPPGVVLNALARLPDGRVLAVGSIGGGAASEDRPVVAIADRNGAYWSVHLVTTSVRTVLRGLAVTLGPPSGTVQVSGAVADGAAPAAAVWFLPLPA